MTVRSTGDVFRKSEEKTRRAKAQVYGALLFLVLVGVLLYYVTSQRPLITTVSRWASEDSSQGSGKEDFFTEFKVTREKVQKEQMDLVKKVIDDPKTSPKVREEAQLHYLAIIDAMGKEAKIEGILKSKGWDSLAFLSGDSCTVVVKAASLGEKEVAQIGDVVKRTAKIPLQNINVIPSPP